MLVPRLPIYTSNLNPSSELQNLYPTEYIETLLRYLMNISNRTSVKMQFSSSPSQTCSTVFPLDSSSILSHLLKPGTWRSPARLASFHTSHVIKKDSLLTITLKYTRDFTTHLFHRHHLDLTYYHFHLDHFNLSVACSLIAI